MREKVGRRKEEEAAAGDEVEWHAEIRFNQTSQKESNFEYETEADRLPTKEKPNK